uniref:Uncharacterized protein n=1 Tax=Anguilla anguilla TaxID=7936 RepID=A0A0E9S8K2_ANGAN
MNLQYIPNRVVIETVYLSLNTGH